MPTVSITKSLVVCRQPDSSSRDTRRPHFLTLLSLPPYAGGCILTPLRHRVPALRPSLALVAPPSAGDASTGSLPGIFMAGDIPFCLPHPKLQLSPSVSVLVNLTFGRILIDRLLVTDGPQITPPLVLSR